MTKQMKSQCWLRWKDKIIFLTVSGCTNVVRLEGVSGNYLRSICAFDQSAQYEAANRTCLSKGMNLFIIDNQAIHDSFSNTIFAVYGWVSYLSPFFLVVAMNTFHNKYNTIYIRYWINGKKTANGWFSYDPASSPIYPGAMWFNNDQNGGDCLSAFKSTKFSPMTIASTNCADSYYVFCEFNWMFDNFYSRKSLNTHHWE